MLVSLLTVAPLVVATLAVPSSSFVQHEKRDRLPPGWSRTHRLPKHEVLPVRIALAQTNLHKVEEFLLDVSHPNSANFGKHWDAQKVTDSFAPSQETVDSVTEWLTTSGIAANRLEHSQSFGWLTFNATVGEAEDLLKTEFYRHEHVSGKPQIACDQYHIPDQLVPHIDFITPTVDFDTKVPQAVVKRDDATSKAAAGVPVRTKAAVNILKSPTNGYQPKQGAILDSLQGIIDELKNCNKAIVPDCLRALYLFPPGLTANSKNSYGIVEYTRESSLQSDEPELIL